MNISTQQLLLIVVLIGLLFGVVNIKWLIVALVVYMLVT